jgi:hypothetical protein
VVTAFAAVPGGTLLRVWEQAGVSGKATVVLPAGKRAVSAIPVNLRGERTGERIPLKGQELVFPLAAYAPASFLLEEIDR